jgi:hypothetical protein
MLQILFLSILEFNSAVWITLPPLLTDQERVSVYRVYSEIIIFWYLYIKCSILYKGYGLRLNICMCYSWETVLSMASMSHSITCRNGKAHGDINSSKAYITNIRLTVESSMGVILLWVCVWRKYSQGTFGVILIKSEQIWFETKYP